MTVTGTIYRIDNTQEISEKFKKREFILEVEDNGYKQHILLQVVQAKCDMLDSYTTGDVVECAINLRGRLWEKDGVEKCFNSIECWKMQKAQANYTAESIANAGATHADEEEDLLPF